MGGTLVFVHGTGVRQAGYLATLRAVEDGVHKRLPSATVSGVDWGSRCGTSLDRVGDVLPPEMFARDVSGTLSPSEADVVAARWALLIEDPLFELRLAGEQMHVPQRPSFGPLPEQAVLDRLAEVGRAPPDVSGSGVGTAEIAEATIWVRNTPELLAAARGTTGPSDPLLAVAIASAIVGRVLAEHRYDEPGTAPLIAVDGSIRDKLVTGLQSAIAPETSREFVPDWAKSKMRRFVERRATAAMAARRTALMGTSAPGIGDILFYQRRGEEIRQLVANSLRDATQPVVAVGHSLGGVVLVDLLSGPQAPVVSQLVTVGSQSPLFYLFDCLVYLRRDAPWPAPFTPWLNIYNRQDFLSFCAARVFADIGGISDEAVDPGVPFPGSHSAYWHHGPVYDLIAAMWPRP